ncbi:17959_t:CDS:2 [Gigaspora rosea]|nr:17959_t:CDS:2 [Gigaspora rosea]
MHISEQRSHNTYQPKGFNKVNDGSTKTLMVIKLPRPTSM